MSMQKKDDLGLPLAATDRPFAHNAKSRRVLACVLCQQRKVKCDRKFPCVNCTRSQAQCVPAATLVPRPRRRRLPERELLDRLHHYESLLRNSKIEFEPLDKDGPGAGKQLINEDAEGHAHDTQDDERLVHIAGVDQLSSPSIAVKSEIKYEAKNFWNAMNQKSESRSTEENSSDSSPDGVCEAAVKDAWKERYQKNDHLLFGSRDIAVDVATLHPEQVQIFRLWQVYIDNVNPLLKVTHIPTLQARIIDAASNVSRIEPTLAALMFSIYCVSIMSLEEDKCRPMFGSSKEDLSTRYQIGCQQALMKCGILRSSDRNCLTALYLYLISIRPNTDPQSLSSVLGAAVRIAQRMGLYNEAASAKYPALEAEMRRRLWWSLVLFDTRICELADYKTAVLLPTWDCGIPLNLNDFDLQPEMRYPPAAQERSSEALFAVVRSEMGDFVRHSTFHLDFVNPILKAVAENVQSCRDSDRGDLTALEKMIEDKYLKFCNPENPLHYMTIWTARDYLAKCGLLEHYSKFPKPSVQQTDVRRDAAVLHARRILDCDTRLMTSSLIKGYLWFINLHFPFPAYVHLVHDLKTRPASNDAQRTWEILSDNYEARFMSLRKDDILLFKLFTKMVLQAWEACEVVFRKSGNPLLPPPIVSDMKERMASSAQARDDVRLKQPSDIPGTNTNLPMLSVDSSCRGLLYGNVGQEYAEPESRPYHEMLGQSALDVDLDDMSWTQMDWF